MKLKDAQAEAERLNKLNGQTAKPVRILPAHIDPIKPDDNGWDVEVTVSEAMRAMRVSAYFS